MNQAELSARTNGVKAAARARRKIVDFLIDLSRADAQQLLANDRPGDLLNVCADLCRWGFYRGMRPRESRGEELVAIFRANPELLRTLIENLRRLLDVAADGGVPYRFNFVPGAGVVFDFYVGYGPERVAQTLKARGQLRIDSPYYTQKRRPPTIWLQCPWADGEGFQQMALYRAMMLLSDSNEGAMVRRCLRETCRRVFLATRPKQIFHSRQCASAAVFDRYKKKLGDEAYRAKHLEAVLRSKAKKADELSEAKQSTRERLARSAKTLAKQRH